MKANKKCNGCLPSRLGHCRNSDTNRTSSPSSLTSSSNSCPPTSSTSSATSPLSPRTSLSVSSSAVYRSSPRFTWGTRDAASFLQDLDRAYSIVVHWKRNLFRVPSGNVGKLFVTELTRLYDAFASESSLESIAVKATIVIPHLLLQKPHSRSKTKEHISCLGRRLKQWKDGDITNLLEEGSTIQAYMLRPSHQKGNVKNRSKQLADLVFGGKIKQATNMLSEEGKAGILRLDDNISSMTGDQSVKEVLKSKHPQPQAADLNACMYNRNSTSSSPNSFRSN